MLAKITSNFKFIFAGLIALALVLFYFIGSSEEGNSLVRKLAEGNRDEKLIAMATIRETGQANRKIIKILRKQMLNSDSELRNSATQTLTAIDREEAVEALTVALNEQDPSVRLEAAESLEKMGTSGAQSALSEFTEEATAYSNQAAIMQLSKKAKKSREREQKRAYREHRATYGE